MTGKLGLRAIVRSVLAASAALATSLDAVSAETILKVRLVGDIQQIDPLATTSYPVRDVSYLIYDTLFSTDANYNVRPQMVDTFEVSQDGLTYTFTLRSGLKWHDGEPVTSADCIASLKRWMEKDALGGQIKANLDRLEETDDKTFKLILAKPVPLTLAALGKMSSYVPFMMPKRLANVAPNQSNTEAIGSGPYVLKKDEWVPGARIVLVKNKAYVPRTEAPSFLAGAKTAGADRIERIHFPDDVSAVNALLAGEIDYMEGLPPDMLPLLEPNPSITLHRRNPLGLGVQIVLNHLQPPFNDIKVRHAVQWALGQKEMLEAYFGKRTNLFRICPALFFCGGPYESDVNSERLTTRDPKKAKSLLAEAQYGGTPIVVMHPTDVKEHDDIISVIVQQLREAGFTVEDRRIDMATMFSWRTSKAAAKDGGWHIFMTGWGGVDMMSPATNVFVTGACDKAWFGWPCDQELQQLRSEFFAASTEDERKTVATKIQKRAWEVAPFIPGGQHFPTNAWNRKVKGVFDSPVPVLWNLTKAE